MLDFNITIIHSDLAAASNIVHLCDAVSHALCDLGFLRVLEWASCPSYTHTNSVIHRPDNKSLHGTLMVAK